MSKLLLLSVISSATVLIGGTHPSAFRRPLVFEPNRGQAPAQVNWLAHGPGYQLVLTNEGMTMLLKDGAAATPASKYSAVKMTLTGSHPWRNVTGLEPTGGISNYFRGNDTASWRANIPQYARVSASRVYDGIDLVFYSHGTDLEYDFVVAPGADPGRIRLVFTGMDSMRVDAKSGDLILTTAGGAEVRQGRPKVYQQIGHRRVEVAGGYRLMENGVAAFTLSAYDKRRPLVIDPTVTFTTFLRGSDFDSAVGVVTDSAGNAYVGGKTLSTDFPTNDSSLQLNQPFSDGFVTKLSPQGAILFSTYLGGSQFDGVSGIGIDDTGVYVTGTTDSPDFPHQVLKRTQGSNDIFVTKIFLDGNGIFYTTIIGGPSDDDFGLGIALNPSTHEQYVVGSTTAFAPAGKTNVFLHKLDAAGNLVQTAFMGGSDSGQGRDIALDHNGDVWVTGTTCAHDFPIVFPTPQPYPVTLPFHCPGFIAKWAPDLLTLKMSRYWAPAAGIAIDAGNNAYVTGFADTSAFSTVAGAFQVNPPNDSPAYVTKFDSSGNVLKSTYLGGTTGDSGGDWVALNTAGEVYVAGGTSSSDFPGGAPLTPNPTAGFLTKMTNDLSTLLSTTFLGAQMNAVAVFESAPPFSVPQMYTVGRRFTGGLDSENSDAFVVKLLDDVDRWQILQQNPTSREMSEMMLDGNNGVSGTQAIALPCATSDACSPNWKLFGALDFNLDGFADLVQYNATTGELRAWLRDSAGTGAVTGPLSLSRLCGPSDGCSTTLEPVGTGDFNHDGIGDLLWHNNATGELQAWLLNGAGGVIGTLTVGSKCGTANGCWVRTQIMGIGDFDRDGIDDLFYRDILTGRVTVVMLNGSGGVKATQILTQTCGPLDKCALKWSAVGVADVNHDGFVDLLWENPATGDLQAWLLSGTAKLIGIQPLAQPCPKCTQTSPPAGILRDLHITRQVL